MAATERPVTFSWVPKGAGKGGQFSNATSHDSDTDYLAYVNELIIDGGRWLARPGETFYVATTDGVGPQGAADAIMVFNSWGSTSKTYTSYLIYEYKKLADSTARISWKNSNGFSGAFTGSMGPFSSTGAGVPGTFQAVKNRCYYSNGALNTVTYGLPGGPAIFYDSSKAGVTLGFEKWGLPASITNLTITPTSYDSGTGDTHGTITVDNLSFNPQTHLAVGMPFYIETSPGSGAFNQYVIATTPTPASVTLTTATVENYVGAKVQGNYGSMSWGNVTPIIQTGTATTDGTAVVTALSFDPRINCKAGYTFEIEKAAGTNLWSRYVILSVDSVSQVTLTTAASENYVGAKVRVDLPTSVAANSTSSVYRYAISYYDSARGHIGDIGPTFTVNFGAPFNNRIDLIVSNIVDYEKNPDPNLTTNNPIMQYDKIILWRSANDGATLQPMVLLNKAGSGAGYVQSYTDRLADDTQLGLVAPYTAATAPGTHARPPIDLNYATYWQGRFFGSSTSNPGILYWSSIATETGGYGVPEECWNPLSTIPIPESDGVIVGMKAVGGSLLVFTQNNIYQVQNTTTIPIFSLQRLSAKGRGTSQTAIATLPGEDSSSGDILVHYGNDNRVYFLYGAGGDIPFSYPVQPSLNTFGPSSNVGTGIFHNQHSTYIIIQSLTNLALTMIYDLDRKLWLSTLIPPSAFTEGLYGGAIKAFVAGADSDPNIYTLMTSVNTNPPSVCSLWTQQVNVPGVPRHDEKRLQAVIVYGNPGAGTFAVRATTDEGATPITLTEITTGLDPRFSAYLDATDSHLFVPQGSTASGRTFQIKVDWTPVTASSYVSEIMAIWGVSTDTASVGGII